MAFIPQTVFSCRDSNGVVLRGLDWFGAPGAAAVTRKRCYLHDLVMPGQKTLREIDKKIELCILAQMYRSFYWNPTHCLLESPMPPRCLLDASQMLP